VPSLGGTSYTFELWVEMPTTPPASTDAVILSLKQTDSLAATIYVDTSGFLAISGVNSGVSLCDGGIHHVAAVVSGSATSLYIDGVLIGTGSAWTPTTRLTLGAIDNGSGGEKFFSGSVAYVGIYDSALTGTRVAQHFGAGGGFIGERTDQRVSRLVGYRANTGTNLDTGLSTMGLQDISGRSLQDCLFEVGQIEAGVVYVDGLGQVNLRSRSRLFNPTATLDMSKGGVDFGSYWREDTQNVLNDVVVTNTTTGSDQRFVDSDSVSQDGEYSTSLQLATNGDSDALSLAGWIVANGTQQQLTATPLIINLLHISPSQAQAVLELAPLDCVELTNCPGTAPASTLTYIVQGGVTSLGADAASVALNVTALPIQVAIWDDASTPWDGTAVWAF
jgi:hypothetical protein